MTMTTIIASVIALFVGIAIGWFIMRLAMKYRAQNIIKEAEAEAEVIKKKNSYRSKPNMKNRLLPEIISC